MFESTFSTNQCTDNVLANKIELKSFLGLISIKASMYDNNICFESHKTDTKQHEVGNKF